MVYYKARSAASARPAISSIGVKTVRSTGACLFGQPTHPVDQSGQFTAWPKRDASLLYSLKQGIVSGHADAVISSGSLDVTRTEAVTAFLAFVVRYTRGWLSTNRPQLFRRRRPVWLLNVGLPAA